MHFLEVHEKLSNRDQDFVLSDGICLTMGQNVSPCILGLITQSNPIKLHATSNGVINLEETSLERGTLASLLTRYTKMSYHLMSTHITQAIKRANRKLAMIKRSFTHLDGKMVRWSCNFTQFVYQTRLSKLKLPSPSFRRMRGDMVEIYKFCHGYPLGKVRTCTTSRPQLVRSYGTTTE